MAVVQPQTKIVKTLDNKTGKLKKEDIEKALDGRPLGSPINGRTEGEQFEVTLTGEIQITDFNGQKRARFTTKEGYNINVNASYDPTIHKAGYKSQAVCMVMDTTNTDGTTRKVKYCAFVL